MASNPEQILELSLIRCERYEKKLRAAQEELTWLRGALRAALDIVKAERAKGRT